MDQEVLDGLWCEKHVVECTGRADSVCLRLYGQTYISRCFQSDVHRAAKLCPRSRSIDVVIRRYRVS